MSNFNPPPIQEPMIEQEGTCRLAWALFFNSLFTGDTGTAWTPTFTSLTTVGTPTITGAYYRISQGLYYFRVTITPATSTTSTAGTTYINNFPLTLQSDGACLAVSGNLGTAAGHCVASNNRIYVPAWSAVTVSLSIVGLVEAR
jgi:hypothetical protein